MATSRSSQPIHGTLAVRPNLRHGLTVRPSTREQFAEAKPVETIRLRQASPASMLKFQFQFAAYTKRVMRGHRHAPTVRPRTARREPGRVTPARRTVRRGAPSPGREPDKPEPPLGRPQSARHTATKARYAASRASSLRSHWPQTGRPCSSSRSSTPQDGHRPSSRSPRSSASTAPKSGRERGR